MKLRNFTRQEWFLNYICYKVTIKNYILKSSSSSARNGQSGRISFVKKGERKEDEGGIKEKTTASFYLRICEHHPSPRFPPPRETQSESISTPTVARTRAGAHGRREESHSVAWNEKFEFRAVTGGGSGRERKEVIGCLARFFPHEIDARHHFASPSAAAVVTSLSSLSSGNVAL